MRQQNFLELIEKRPSQCTTECNHIMSFSKELIRSLKVIQIQSISFLIYLFNNDLYGNHFDTENSLSYPYVYAI